MKKNLLFVSFILSSFLVKAQCPDLVGAMVNACGINEGSNEFVVFNTTTTANASTYRLFYGTTNPPTANALAGSDATAKTGTGTITGAGCTVVEVTSPSTSIPASSKVIFLPAGFDQAYDATALCGNGTIYVVYIRTNANGGSNSNWSATGTVANTPTTPRFLQVTYSGSASCNGTSAPVKSYTNSWSSNADGNFVTWNGTTPTYTNYGCTNIVLPINLLSFSASSNNNTVTLKWLTSNESHLRDYVIEKSENGFNFNPIATVAAKNNADNSYQYTDVAITKTTLYYRLKIEDMDDKIKYSSVARIDNIDAKSKLFVYPTVASTIINAKLKGDKNVFATIQIIDAIGKVVTQKNWNISNGINTIPIDINNLANGIYRLRIIGENINYIASFIKN